MIAKLISYSKPSEFEIWDTGNDESHKNLVLGCQDLVAYCARVSNPSNQNNTKTSEKLLKLSLIHISEPTNQRGSRMPSSA